MSSRRTDSVVTGRPPRLSTDEAVDRLWERSSRQARAQLRLEGELRLLTQAVGGLREVLAALSGTVREHQDRIAGATGGWTAGRGVALLAGGLVVSGLTWWMSMVAADVQTAQHTADAATRAQDRFEVRARYDARVV